MDLQEFDFEVKHRAGCAHNNADALSRLQPTPELIRKLQQDAINTCSVMLNSSINIRDAQEQDASIAKLRDLKLRNQPKPSARKSQDVYFHKMLRHYDKLFIREGILVCAIGQRKSYANYVIVLPQSLITTCVKAMHDSPIAGHMGVARMEERIRQLFYWPGIHNSVQTCIHNCCACAQRKIATHNNKAPTQHIKVGEPFTFWAIPLPETACGNCHILVIE